MALLPKDMRLKIEQIIEDRRIQSDLRGYLGLSGIGDPCARKLWYAFRLCFREEFVSRQERLFSRGHNEEPIIQRDLKRAGVICHVDPDNQPEVIAGNGHIKGHMDDILTNVPDAPKTKHLGEYKTANDRNFKEMQKKGVKVSKPIYYDQMQCYMHLLKLTRALFIMVNKNDDSRYYERVSLDKDRAEFLLKRGFDIISTEIPPAREWGPDWYACKWCAAYEICHFGEEPIQSCRTCKNVAICNEGKWECDLHGMELAFKQQVLSCSKFDRFDILR